MDDVPIQKIQISGPTLASLLHRFSSSPGSLHGLLFGHVTISTSSSLSDDPSSASSTSGHPSSADDATPLLLTATVTSFLSLPSHLPLPLQTLADPPSSSLLGWFSGRRRTPLRPSLNDSTTTHDLSSSTSLSFTPQNPTAQPQTLTLAPSLFFLMTTPLQDQLTHTHDYKAFHYRISTNSFDPISLSIINIGPSFRTQYGSFSPNALFPLMPCHFRGSSPMAEDEKKETSGDLKRGSKDQKELNMFAEGFDIGRLNRLMGPEAANYTAELEDLYYKMLSKLDALTRLAESSSAKVLEQENRNMKLRLKVAGLE